MRKDTEEEGGGLKFKRIYSDEQGNVWFPPDEATYAKHRNGEWMLKHPKVGVGSLVNHEVIEHEDGTITVSPSILIRGVKGEVHGYLERGVWRDT